MMTDARALNSFQELAPGNSSKIICSEKFYKIIILSVLFLFQGLLLATDARAQEEKENTFLHPDKFYKKFFPHLKYKRNPADTSFIKTYPNYLSVAAHLLAPKIFINLVPRSTSGVEDHSSKFRTSIHTIVGISASYRFVSAGFAFALKSNPENNTGYTHTSYRTATIRYNGTKYILQFRYMKVKGLTDINKTNNTDSTQEYHTRPDILMKEFQFEGIYNFNWKKYSYIAPLDFTQRQVKSQLGFMVKSGIYFNQLSGDSNLLSVLQRPYFKGVDTISRLVGYSIKLAPGLGGTLVLHKKFYLATAVFIPYNLYLSRLYTLDGKLSRKETAIQVTLDGTCCIGYQSTRFYAGLRCQIESKQAKIKYFSYSSLYGYIGLDVGYRLDAPKVLKKFYKKTMPPGM